MKKESGDAGYPAKYIEPKTYMRGSFLMSNQYSRYSTSVIYSADDGKQRCRFNAGYVLNSTGPTFTSSVDKLIPGSNCSIMLAGQKYTAPYDFTVYISFN